MSKSADRPDGDRQPDSLDLLAEQDRVLVQIFDGWDRTDPKGDYGSSPVDRAWDRGTYGKLLIEHAADRVAAKEDVVRVLRDADRSDLADPFGAHLPEVRRLLDRLDELARGVAPIAVAASAEFAETVDALSGTMRADVSVELDGGLRQIADGLADRRRLRSAAFVSARAPTHPGLSRPWYDDVPSLAYIHARYDELRGSPWGHSKYVADTKLSEGNDQQT